ncbi:hypothetical protein ACS0TY_020651 [Phlomoides rotata]
MKRVSEVVDGGNEELGSKKIKFLNGSDESSLALDRNEPEEERVVVENGAIDPAEVDTNGGLLGDVGGHDHDGPSFGGLDEHNMWGYDDISFDSIFGIEEEHKDLVFDLNLPVYRAHDSGMGQGCFEYNPGPSIDKSKVEIIDIASDSEDEVEIIGCSNGYSEIDKQIKLGMPCNRIDDLSLRLGVFSIENALGESSSVAGGERRYTREEKGKANVVEDGFVDDSVIDSWLSLKAYSPIGLNLLDSSDESIMLIEPAENVVVGNWLPAVPVPVPDAGFEMAERARRQAEEVLRNRQRFSRESLRLTARQFARMSYPDQDNGNQPSSKKQEPSTSKVAEQLGKSPGPFSDALKMVRERTSKRAADHLIEWRCLEENQDRSSSTVFVPSLLDLSLRALAKSAEGLVSLGHVPDNLRRRLTNILCDTSKMNVHIMNLLVEGCPTEIRIKNCSWLTDDQFNHTFGNWRTKDLRVLQLDLCGQCMLDSTFGKTLAQSSNAFSSLAIVSLRGACRLSDSGLKVLIMSAPALRSINLGQCTLLTSNSVNFIADSLGSILRELYIDDCNKIDAMLILPAFKKFRCLEVLSVARMLSVTDHFVSELVKVCGRSIRELDLANCTQLTDCSLKTIGGSCADLCSVNLSYLHNLSDLGMEYLANGCRSIQKLKLCRNDFSDETMAAFLESSGESLTELLLNSMAKIGPNTAYSLAKRSRKLSSLDISWCRKITDEALGLIVDSCSSLKFLKAFGCRQITSKFLNGHSNRHVRIIGLDLTPILDHMNVLEPEEVLLRYSSMPSCMEN